MDNQVKKSSLPRWGKKNISSLRVGYQDLLGATLVEYSGFKMLVAPF